jgi:putative ABC transport system permease protein
VARQIGNLAVGRTVNWGGASWDVVGVFDAEGGSAESELWCDIDMLQQVFRRQNTFQAVYAQLNSPNSLEEFRSALLRDPRLEVDVTDEQTYYAEQSRSLTTLISTAGAFIGVLMAAGAVFGAMNTMYTAVASRTREIATLRAIGFGGVPIICSVLVEATVLAVIGGIIGGATAWVLFDGYTVSTLNFQSLSQVAFAFAVTPTLILQGVGSAIVMGLVGALWPAWRAVRVSVTTGLREL